MHTALVGGWKEHWVRCGTDREHKPTCYSHDEAKQKTNTHMKTQYFENKITKCIVIMAELT